MNRSLMLNIHLILSSVFVPFLLIIPLSGSLYLFGVKGDVAKTQIVQVEAQVPSEMKEKEAFFRKLYADQNIEFDFEYIKETPNELIFRPTTRDFYTAVVKDGKVTLYQAKPSVLSKLMELHKGHGPQSLRKFEAIFGTALILILISGLWLALTIPKYRKITLVSFGIGVVLMGVFLT